MILEAHFKDSNYPLLLKNTPKPPNKIYIKGDISKNIFDNCVGMVGSRNISLYGKRVIRHLISRLSKEITVVSGFMYGVDKFCHLEALRNGLKTIAVMPCGINYIHPENQKDLYENILDNKGLIVSEYEKDFKPQLWTYPKRNRIVAGLCKCLIVIEAGAGSGSLITANYAHAFGRKVYCIPASIFSENFKGIYQLLNSFAKPLISADQINHELNLQFMGQISLDKKFSGNHKSLLDLLKDEPLSVDEISHHIKLPPGDVSCELTILSLSGLIMEEAGRWYAC